MKISKDTMNSILAFLVVFTPATFMLIEIGALNSLCPLLGVIFSFICFIITIGINLIDNPYIVISILWLTPLIGGGIVWHLM